MYGIDMYEEIIYVIVISRARGLYQIYCTGAQGLRAISRPSGRDITILYPEAVDTDWSVIALLGSLGNCHEMPS